MFEKVRRVRSYSSRTDCLSVCLSVCLSLCVQKVFVADIEELIGMADLWKGRAPPHALHPTALPDTAPPQKEVRTV